jgi:carbamoyl-phosphate synthase small subunit
MTTSFYSAPNAALIFPTGEVIYGVGIGKKGKTIGEICFNTAIAGYQEILTDPSYSGQIITFTFPHIGNIGVNDSDIESIKPKAKGLIIRENITNPASYRSQNHLSDWLIKNEITGICGVDTRKITKDIKAKGAKNVAIIYNDNIEDINVNDVIKELQASGDLDGVELAESASLNKKYSWQNEGRWNQQDNSYNQVQNKKLKVVAIDFGAKLNILRCLTEAGCDVTIMPAKTSAEEILQQKPDGVFLSNGPGDPAETGKYAVPMIQKIVDSNIPLFGICLGHQLLALAMGAKTSKMHQGHRGANHPVQDLKTKKVERTSQNHGFCVDEATLPSSLEITHRSLFDGTIEGIKVKNKSAFSVQYHPESSPGPSDSYYLFEEFIKLMS